MLEIIKWNKVEYLMKKLKNDFVLLKTLFYTKDVYFLLIAGDKWNKVKYHPDEKLKNDFVLFKTQIFIYLSIYLSIYVCFCVRDNVRDHKY